ncbi:hypothetical protein ACG3SL_09320 [Sphingomonas sp. CJ20]
MTDSNWGERRLSARDRRRRTIRVAMIVAAIAFGVFAPKLVAPGPDAALVKFLLSLVYAGVIFVGGLVLWRQTDEVERQRAIHAAAAMGFTSLFATVLVMLAAPVFGLHNPAMIIFWISLAAGAVTWVVQRVRG